MRTTLTLDPDVEMLVRSRMRERGLSFKQALNGLVRDGAAQKAPERVSTPTANLGAPLVDLDRALTLASALEDEELARKLATGR